MNAVARRRIAPTRCVTELGVRARGARLPPRPPLPPPLRLRPAVAGPSVHAPFRPPPSRRASYEVVPAGPKEAKAKPIAPTKRRAPETIGRKQEGAVATPPRPSATEGTVAHAPGHALAMGATAAADAFAASPRQAPAGRQDAVAARPREAALAVRPDGLVELARRVPEVPQEGIDDRLARDSVVRRPGPPLTGARQVGPGPGLGVGVIRPLSRLNRPPAHGPGPLLVPIKGRASGDDLDSGVAHPPPKAERQAPRNPLLRPAKAGKRAARTAKGRPQTGGRQAPRPPPTEPVTQALAAARLREAKRTLASLVSRASPPLLAVTRALGDSQAPRSRPCARGPGSARRSTAPR